MTEHDEEFWWSEWGRKTALEIEIKSSYFFIWIGVGFMFFSLFAIDQNVQYGMNLFGIIIIASATIQTWLDYKNTEEWLEENK